MKNQRNQTLKFDVFGPFWLILSQKRQQMEDNLSDKIGMCKVKCIEHFITALSMVNEVRYILNW